MSSTRTIPYIVFGGAFLFVVLLCLAPRLPESIRTQLGSLSESDLQIREAVQLVEGQNPMAGIRMLKEILEDDPENLEALWHLGLFSLKSNQIDKAEERFVELIRLNQDREPEYVHAHFYLGNIYATKGQYDDALGEFEHYQGVVGDTAVVSKMEVVIKDLQTYSQTH